MLFGFADKNQPVKLDPTKPGGELIDDELLDEEEESVGEEVTKTLVALMPWGISILFHVALLVVAFFIVWQTISQEKENEPVDNESQLVDTPGAPVEPQKNEEVTDDAPPTVPTETSKPDPSPARVDTPRKMTMRGATTSGGQAGGPPSFGSGTGKFGATVFGNPGGNAKDIAFVVDASGSMVDVLPFVIKELTRVVDGLKPQQKITIIFFSGEGVFDVLGGGSSKKLRACKSDFKRVIKDWIRLENHRFKTGGRGSKYAQQAIVRAIEYRPQLVFLLSDNLTGGGQGATQHELNQDDLMEAIVAANKKNRESKINTIQFLYEDPLIHQGLKGTLKRISEETGGKWKFYGAEALKLKK